MGRLIRCCWIASCAAIGSAADYERTRTEELDRIEARLRQGALSHIEMPAVRGRPDLLAIQFGIQTAPCQVDHTLAIYRRAGLVRLARINAEDTYSRGHVLRDFDVGDPDRAGKRLIASAWVASNCSSNWNGNIFRIDAARGASFTNLFQGSAEAYLSSELTTRVAGDTVTFRYMTRSRDPALFIHPAIQRYRVRDGQVTRIAPVALSYGGFIQEWLAMNDHAAAVWSSPPAARMHAEMAAVLGSALIDWVSAADCPGNVREIVVRADPSGRIAAFHIQGRRAAEMKLIRVAERASPECRNVPLRGADPLRPVMDEPPE